MELAGHSALSVALVTSFSILVFNREDLSQFFETLRVTGATLIEHLGWTVSFAITVLLSLYAIQVGQQIVASPAAGARARRSLGVLAEVLVALLIPPMLLLLIACWGDPAHRALLLLLGPAGFVIVTLAVFVGGFITFDPKVQLNEAVSDLSSADRQFRGMTRRAASPTWTVVLVVALMSAAVIVGAHLALSGSFEVEAIVLSLFSSAVLVPLVWRATFFSEIASPGFEKVAPWGVPVTCRQVC